MKIIAVTAAVAVCAAVFLGTAISQAPAPATNEKSAEEPSSRLARYRVMHAFGSIPGAPAIPGEAESNRKAFEDALNKADAEGYQVAGMNDQWVVLQRKPPPVSRRNVILPAQK